MDKRLDTLLAQVGIHQDEATGALVSPLHFSTTYQHPEFGQSTGFDYTRTKNPTRATLEEALASIESANRVVPRCNRLCVKTQWRFFIPKINPIKRNQKKENAK